MWLKHLIALGLIASTGACSTSTGPSSSLRDEKTKKNTAANSIEGVWRLELPSRSEPTIKDKDESYGGFSMFLAIQGNTIKHSHFCMSTEEGVKSIAATVFTTFRMENGKMVLDKEVSELITSSSGSFSCMAHLSKGSYTVEKTLDGKLFLKLENIVSWVFERI